MNQFSSDFLIGAATAAHQVEGNNIHSDYWAMEHMAHSTFNEPSLDAVDHYNRYEEDIQLMAQAGLSAYRFSIEWARIEPEEGKFDETEIAHYRSVLECCHANHITPVVTMMHFTSPVWVIRNGGWENERTVDAFARYCGYVAERLGNLMGYVVTINEANMGLQVAAIAERYKRQMMAKMSQMQAQGLEGTAQIGMNFNTMMENMQLQKQENKDVFGTEEPQNFVSGRTAEGDILVMRAHQAAKKAMKAVKPALQIGLSLSLHDIQAVEGSEENALHEWEEEFSHYVPYILDDDFFGLQIIRDPLSVRTASSRFRRGRRRRRWIMSFTRRRWSMSSGAFPGNLTQTGRKCRSWSRRTASRRRTTQGAWHLSDGRWTALLPAFSRGFL